MTKAVILPLGFIFLLAAATPSHSQTDSNPTDTAVQEAVLRQSYTVTLRQQLVAAKTAESRGELVNAAKLYQNATDLALKIGSGIDLETDQAVKGLTRTRLDLARDAQSRQDYNEASTQINQVLRVNPKSPEALALKRENDQLIEASRGHVPDDATVAQIPVIHNEKVDAGTLVQDGKLLYEMGKLEDAQVKLKQAIKIDPDNEGAFYYLNLIQQAQYNRSASAHTEDTQDRMAQVEKQWVLPKPPGFMVPNPFAATNLIYTGAGREDIANKLNRISIDNVSYDSLPLSEVLRALQESAKVRDPDKMGINFLINPNPDLSDAAASSLTGGGSPGGFPGGFPGGGRAAAVDPATGLPAAGADTGAEQVDVPSVIVKLNLSNVRLIDVLEAIVLVADHPIKYTICDFGVVFSSKSKLNEPMLTRTFKVDANTFFQGLESVSATSFGGVSQSSGGGGGGSSSSGGGQTTGGAVIPVVNMASGAGQIRSTQNGGGQGATQTTQQTGAVGAGGAAGLADRWQIGGQGEGVNFLTVKRTTDEMGILVKSFFYTMGVDLTRAPKAVFFNDRLGLLFVKATQSDLDTIERAIEVLNQLPPQVHMKARFIEVDETAEKDLGFDWYLGQFGSTVVAQGGTAGSLNAPVNQSAPSGIFPTSTTATAIPAGSQSLTTGLYNTAPTLGTITGIMTNPNFQVAIHALETRTGTEELGEPEVTTTSGRQTQMRATTLITVITGLNFQAAQGTTGVGGAAVP